MVNKLLYKCIFEYSENDERYCYLFMTDVFSIYKIETNKYISICNNYKKKPVIIEFAVLLVVIVLFKNLEFKAFYMICIITDIIISCLVVNDLRLYDEWRINELLKNSQVEKIDIAKIKRILYSNKTRIILYPILTVVAFVVLVRSIEDCVLIRNFRWYLIIPFSVTFILLFNSNIDPINIARLYFWTKQFKN